MIDLASKMVVGWQLANRATAQLCIEALEMADRNGHVQPDAIFHSDRGCQGGFQWWSQRLVLGVVRDGCWRALAGDYASTRSRMVAYRAMTAQWRRVADIRAGPARRQDREARWQPGCGA